MTDTTSSHSGPPRKPRRTGRGTALNPPNRFEQIERERHDDLADEADAPLPETTFLRDASRSIIATNDSPDIPYDASINPYRGCEHGCAYCYARPFHEFLGYSAGLDFERIILVKHDAPALLRRTFLRKSWKPQPVELSGVTDPYQPVERRLELTRGCLRVCADFRNPVGVITKNALVTRDADILSELATHSLTGVILSITTLRAELAGILEPRTSTPARRLAAVERLRAAGIPVGVMVSPVIPGLTDEEIPAILRAAANAGAIFASFTMLRLPGAVAQIFSAWLEEHMPDRKEKVLGRLREMRDGALSSSQFGERMRGHGVLSDHITALFAQTARRAGLAASMPPMRTDLFHRPSASQPGLFDPA